MIGGVSCRELLDDGARCVIMVVDDDEFWAARLLVLMLACCDAWQGIYATVQDVRLVVL